MMEDDDQTALQEYEADLEKAEETEEDKEMAMYEPDCGVARRSYIMYHGTTMENAKKIKKWGFIPSPNGMLGRGVYVSRSFQKAKAYPRHPKTNHLAILVLKVRVGRVKKINYNGHPLQRTWHKHGYDTAWVPPNCGMVSSGLQEDCVYDPRRISVLDIIPVKK